LKTKFKIKINPNPKSFIGLQIVINENELQISQTNYISKLAKSLNLDGSSKKLSSPMENNLKLEKSEVPNDDPEFRSFIGALLFVSRFSRLDLLHSRTSRAVPGMGKTGAQNLCQTHYSIFMVHEGIEN